MAGHWPPEGYSTPKEYERSVGIVTLIAILIGLVLIPITIPPIRSAIPPLIDGWVDFGYNVQLSADLLVIGAYFVLLTWMILLLTAMTIVHESFHYGVGHILELEPTFEWDEFVILKNPSIVAYAKGIKRVENLAMLSTPFVFIGLACWITMATTDGLVSGSAALILLTNSAVSGQDIYHILRILKMPNGTQFRNYRDDCQLRTEYVVPRE